MKNSQRPNILLVVFDSLSAKAFDGFASTLPTFGALQAKSVRFSNAYTCSPESSPARASLFTGLDIAAHGVWTDGVALQKRDVTLPESFFRNGYRCWLVGRRQLEGMSNWTTEHARAQEYHHVDWAHGPLHRSRQNAYLSWLQNVEPEIYAGIFPSQPNPDDTDIPAGQRNAMADMPDDLSFNAWIGTQFCARLAEHGDAGPFLGVAGFVVGDAMGAQPQDGTPVESFDERAVRQADKALAMILDSVPENTITVVTAGRGSVPDETLDAPLNEQAIKVPLLLSLQDGSITEVKGDVWEPVSTMDIAPTLYDVAQVTPPKRVQGRSLLTPPCRGWALSRLRHPDRPHQTALSTENWKLVMSHGQTATGEQPTYQLYDLKADPDEVTDLAALPAHSGDVEDMIDMMIDARVALEDRTEPRIAKF